MNKPELASNVKTGGEIVAAMTLKEKVKLMAGRSVNQLILPYHHLIKKQYNLEPYANGSVERLNVGPMKFCDGPRGVVSHSSTCFPVAMARGATFDPELEHRVGEAIAKEVIAAGGNFFAGVCINLLRHPAWGRAQETYGEDPHLLGRMGVAITEGVQSQGVMACVKHFALNSMENARFKVDVQCSERTLREVYLPHFKACIDAGAASVMSAYNKFRGDYCGENSTLLRKILKDEWQFKGFVISDFVWGFHDTAKAANAGMDIEMPWPSHYGKKLLKALKHGDVEESVIDEASRRIVSTIARFNAALNVDHIDKEITACDEHRLLARTVAEKSFTLLKNNGGLLPLDKGSINNLLVLGELATAPNMGDHGSSKVVPPYVVTPLDGLKAYLGTEAKIEHFEKLELGNARALCKAADAVIMFVGSGHDDEGEYIMNSKNSPGGDRDELSLKPAEVSMIEAATAVNKNVIVVLIGGSAFTLSEWQQKVGSILYAYYPGMEGGNALARTFFGDANPGGKLPFTIPKKAEHLPFFDKNADAIEYAYYHGYTLLDKNKIEPAYAFGFGLSYSTFSLSTPHFFEQGEYLCADVSVTNTSTVAGDEVVQLYISCEQSSVDRPDKILCDFKRVSLAANESTSVRLQTSHATLDWYNEDSGCWEAETGQARLYVGNSSRCLT